VITTLTGENDAGRQHELAQMVGDFVAEHGAMAVERLDGEETDYQRMCEAAQSGAFLASEKLVVLRTPGVNKDFKEKIEDYLQSVADTTTVIIVEPRLDKRLSYYKQLKKLTNFKEFAELDVAGVTRFAREYAKQQGGEISAADANYLVERVGAGQMLVQNELDKLLIYDSHISKKSINLLTEPTPASSVFDLLDAAFLGKKDRTMKLYDEQRMLGVEPQQIIAMLAWQLHSLAMVKCLGNMEASEAASRAKISPYTVRKQQNIAKNMSQNQLLDLVSRLLEIDIKSKTSNLLLDDALRHYLLAF